MFETFLGNEKLKEELAQLLTQDRLPHAIAFIGESGVGSGFLARLVAKEYLQDERNLIDRNEHPDYLLMQGSGASGEIAVQDIRDALYELNKAAVMTDGRRLMAIKGGEHLNASSSNALLKMLEEPPQGVVFLISTAHREDLLPTLRSRLVEYTVLPLEESLCAQEALRRVPQADAGQVQSLSKLFSGRLGLVLRALTDPEYLALTRAGADFCKAAISKKEYEALTLLAAAENREQMKMVLEGAVAWVRAMGSQHPEQAAVLRKLSDAFDAAASQLDRYVNLKLCQSVLAKACIEDNG